MTMRQSFGINRLDRFDVNRQLTIRLYFFKATERLALPA